jgi:hypothetical protein
MAAINGDITALYAKYLDAFTWWEIVTSYTFSDFKFMTFSEYERDRESDRYDAENTYLFLIEPPEKWVIGSPSLPGCFVIDSTLSIYLFKRGEMENVSSQSLISYTYSQLISKLEGYLETLKSRHGDNIQVFYPFDITFHIGKTVNREIGIHANIKVKYI